jgi:hypothetical protein
MGEGEEARGGNGDRSWPRKGATRGREGGRGRRRKREETGKMDCGSDRRWAAYHYLSRGYHHQFKISITAGVRPHWIKVDSDGKSHHRRVHNWRWY